MKSESRGGGVLGGRGAPPVVVSLLIHACVVVLEQAMLRGRGTNGSRRKSRRRSYLVRVLLSLLSFMGRNIIASPSMHHKQKLPCCKAATT